MKSVPTTDSRISAHAGNESPTASLHRYRVVLVDHTAKMGGGEIALLNLCSHLDQERFDLHVILFSDGPLREKLNQSGIGTTILELDSGLVNAKKDKLGLSSLLRIVDVFRSIKFAWRLSRVVQKLRANILQTNSLKADILGGIAGRLAGVPVIWHVRDRIADDYLPKKIATAFRLLCQWMPDMVIANSNSTLETLQRNALKQATASTGRVDHMVTVHDGTPMNPASGEVPRSENVRHDMQQRVVSLVGRICRWKGQHIFIRAAALLQKEFPNSVFRIVGSPLFEEKDYEQELHDLVNQLGVNSLVQFTGFRTDVDAVMRESDLVVHASITGEPFGQVVIEAMAAARAVVATNGGGVPEIVLDGITGLLVPMGDADAMARAIRKLLNDPETSHKMGQAGKARVQSFFTIEQTAQKVSAIYMQILRRKIKSKQL